MKAQSLIDWQKRRVADAGIENVISPQIKDSSDDIEPYKVPQERCTQRGRLASYAKKGASALIDQGLFAASNFILNVLLARWLVPTEYGAFSVAFSLFLLIASFYTAILAEPMLVFGAGKYSTEFAKHLGITSCIHVGVSGGIGLVLGIAAFVFWQVGSPLAPALGGLAIASPFILFTWLMRSACYVRSRPQWAAIGGAIHLVLVLIGLYLLLRVGRLTPGWIFACMGVAALLTSIWFVAVLAPARRLGGTSAIREVLRDHWAFGSWNALATALNLASGQILIVMIPPFFGLGAAARVAAALNFLRPLNPVIRSVSGLALPYASRLRVARGNDGRRRFFLRLLLLLPAAVLAYGIVVSLCSSRLLFHVYGSHRYDDCGELIFLLTLTYTASSLLQMLSVPIKAAGATRAMVAVWAFPGVLTCLLSVPALFVGNVSSVLTVFALSYWVGAFQCWRISKAVDSEERWLR